MDISHHMIRRDILQGNRILIIDAQLIQERDDTQYRHAGLFLQEIQRRIKQRDIPSELIDDEPLHQRSFILIEEHQSAYDRRQSAAAIDVGDKENRCIELLGDTHIDDIILLQIHFRRTPGPFDDEHIEMALHVVHSLLHTGPSLLAIAILVLRSTVISDRLTQEHHLRARISCGLQKHRVHFHDGIYTGRFRLGHRRASHFPAGTSHIRIQRHILRLERSRQIPILRENPAKSRTQDTLTYMRTGSLKHDLFRCLHHNSTPLSLSSIVIPATERYTLSERLAIY